jgi:hypothetical protein
MKREGRLIEDSQATSNFSPPNFRTIMDLPTLLHGLSGLLARLYTPRRPTSAAPSVLSSPGSLAQRSGRLNCPWSTTCA